LEVFGHLADKPKSAEQLAADISADKNAVELLLNALTAIEFLEKKGDVYSVTEVSRLYLVPGSDLYMGNYVKNDQVAQAWTQLSSSIKSGKPLQMVNTQAKAEEFFPALAESIFPMNYGSAHSVATELKIEQYGAGTKVLDIAAGSAVWSLPLAERNKNVHVDALDFPPVLEVAKKFATRHGVADRFGYISGDWKHAKLEPESYDIILLGHILHSEGWQRSVELLKESHRLLKKGGKVVVAEMISDNARAHAVFPLLFALNMLIMTEQGCVFTEGELEKILGESGFKNVVRPKLPFWGDESPVMIGTK
jgi:ubiquinone/menaquinone biosynthesis C-methylase UbiE